MGNNPYFINGKLNVLDDKDHEINLLKAVEQMRDEEIASLREAHGNALIQVDQLKAKILYYTEYIITQTKSFDEVAQANIELQSFKAKVMGLEPVGYWHVGETEDESDFFLHKDSGDVRCESCLVLYDLKGIKE